MPALSVHGHAAVPYRRVDDAAPALSELPPVGTDDPKGPTRRDTHFGLAFGGLPVRWKRLPGIGRRRDGLMARRGKAGCVLGLFDGPQHVAVCDDEARIASCGAGSFG